MEAEFAMLGADGGGGGFGSYSWPAGERYPLATPLQHARAMLRL